MEIPGFSILGEFPNRNAVHESMAEAVAESVDESRSGD